MSILQVFFGESDKDEHNVMDRKQGKEEVWKRERQIVCWGAQKSAGNSNVGCLAAVLLMRIFGLFDY